METTNFGNFDTLKLIGYMYSNKFLYLTVWLISFGLIKYIPPKIQILLFYKKCLLSKSTHILVEGFDNFTKIVKVETEEIPIIQENDNIINQFGNIVRSFEVFKTKFLFNRIQEKFMRPIYPEHEMKQRIELYKSFLENPTNNLDIKEDSQIIQKLYYGENTTDLPLPTVFEVFVMNIFTLENLYLLTVLIIWYFTDYKIYAIILAFITIYTLSVDIYKQICSNRKISLQVKKSENSLINKLYIIDNKIVKKEVDTKHLFPGDLIELRDCEKFCCDAIIIKGSLLVDESFLTGESIPIPKFENESIFSGTKISNTSIITTTSSFHSSYVNTSGYDINKDLHLSCIAMVTKTGFNTSHGSLLKTILFPKKASTDTFRHTNLIFKIAFTILCSVFLFMILYFIAIERQIIKLYITRIFKNKERKYQLILNLGTYGPYILSFDLVTVLMSPAFSAALKLGLMNSISRLKKSYIDCMSISAIDEVGLVDVTVFDKTGTLTESYMELYKSITPEIDTSDFNEIIRLMEIAKASCHNLQLASNKQNVTNEDCNTKLELLGDPMDISMVQSTKSMFVNSNLIILDFEGEKIEIEIKKRIPFSTERKRISVFLKIGTKDFLITKGSPEMIEKLLKNVHKSYKNDLEDFSLQGYRVLSVGYKECKEENFDETDMTFLGFILFSNPLKKDTFSTIESLKLAEIPSIICTGDSILTGLSVARELKMVEDVVMPVVNTKYREKEGEEVIKTNDMEIQKEEQTMKKSRLLLGSKTLKPIVTNESCSVESENDSIKNKIKITANDTTSPLRWICTNINETDLENIPIAIEGPCFNYIRENESDLYKQLLKRCLIYARMNPEQKMHLVNDLKYLEKEYYFSKPLNNSDKVENTKRNVSRSLEDRIFNDPYDKYIDIEKDKLKILYCGDGANDCGALNASTIGISLSPHISICQFISRTGNINNVKTIISEGRSALVTSMSAFRNVCETSLLSYIVLAILMLSGSFLSEYETMHHDLCLILPLNLLLSTFKPVNKLWNINKFKNNIVTLNRFLYVEILNSLKFVMISIFSSVCVLTYFFLVPDRCSCFKEIESEFIVVESPIMFHTKKSTVFYFVLSIQIFLSCIYNCRGEPHRIEKYKNFAFLCYVLANSAIFLFLCTLAIGIFPKIAEKMFICKLNFNEILLVVVLFVFNILTYMYLHKREERKLTRKRNKKANK